MNGQHITDRHLLDLSDADEEAIILMCEANSNRTLLKGAKDVLKGYKRFKNALDVAERTGDPTLIY